MHAERLIQFLLAGVRPIQLIRFRRRNRRCGHAKIGVRVMRTKTTVEFLKTQPIQHLRSVIAQIF